MYKVDSMHLFFFSRFLFTAVYFGSEAHLLLSTKSPKHITKTQQEEEAAEIQANHKGY